MKFMALSLLFVFFAAHVALAQSPVVPAPVVVASPAVVAPVAVVASVGVLAFIKANWGEICFALSWLIEGVFYFSPALKANSLLEQIEAWIKGQSVPPAL